MITIRSYKRCESCEKYKSTEKEIKIGDKVNFGITTIRGRRASCSVRTGKVQTIISPERVGVVYRKKLHIVGVDGLSDPEGASALSVALLGECECK